MRQSGKLFLSLALSTLFFGHSPSQALSEQTNTTAPPAVHKRALLIAVHKYDQGRLGDPHDLNTIADVRALQTVLTSKFGFTPGDITVLEREEDTTHAKVIAAFRDLIAKTESGDIVYFHFSGHGSQVPDPTQHKLSGMDQTIVPTDYDFSKTKEYCNEIIDRDISALINDLLAKHPTIVTMTFDSCHSGSVTRATTIVRGFDYPGKMPGQTRSLTSTPDPDAKMVKAEGRNLVVIAACRPDQQAIETIDENQKHLGLFTYSLTRALAKAGPETTYRDLLEDVNATMSTRECIPQTPQLDGDIDNVLMSGIAIPAQPAIDVVRHGDGTLTLKAGELQGMTIGSRFSIFSGKEKILDHDRAVAEAKITKTELGQSELALDGGKNTDLSGLGSVFKAKEISHSYADSRLRLIIDDLDEATAKLIAGRLASENAVTVQIGSQSHNSAGDTWDVFARKTNAAGNNVVLERTDGYSLSNFKIMPGSADANDQIDILKKRLEAEYRWRYLRALQNSDSNSEIAVDVRVQPVEIKERNERGRPTKVADLKRGKSASATIALAEKTYFMLEVRNRGSRPAFISVLDLQQEGSISPLYPLPQLKLVQDNQIPADKNWHRIPLPYVFQINPPLGMEVIKVIATAEPADFTPLFQETTTRSLGDAALSMHPIAKLFVLANSGRRSGGAVAPPSNWATATTMIEGRPASDK